MLAVLLSTYNGADFLSTQLDSLEKQSYRDFQLYVRDDGSSDTTVEILSSYDCKQLDSSENLGSTESFLRLLKYALQESENRYFMFCDQDDFWKEDKIEKSLQKMRDLEKRFAKKPLLVHTDLEVVDASLQRVKDSFWEYEKIDPSLNSFHRLLMQNTVTGCTVIINRELAEMVSSPASKAVLHDSWLALIASYFGTIDFIPESTILYRQHQQNSIGTKGISLDYLINRLQKRDFLFRNIAQAKAFLELYGDRLDKETLLMLEDFISIESKTFFQKRKILLKYKLLKQGFLRNLGLLVKV